MEGKGGEGVRWRERVRWSGRRGEMEGKGKMELEKN